MKILKLFDCLIFLFLEIEWFLKKKRIANAIESSRGKDSKAIYRSCFELLFD